MRDLNLPDRKLLKKLAIDLLDCCEDEETSLEFKQAICTGDWDKIKFFISMAPVQGVRQMIMNVHSYRMGLRFGFLEIKFNEYGWLDNNSWQLEEDVEIRVCKKHDKNYAKNVVRLAMGPNGKWAYSISYGLGTGSGGGWSPNVFREIFNNREDAYYAGIDDMYNRHKSSLEMSNDINHDHSYNNKVIAWIQENVLKKEKQLTLF